MQDIQTIVEKGCPNINRKTVNSGKRLRAHLQLDEGDVSYFSIKRNNMIHIMVLLSGHVFSLNMSFFLIKTLFGLHFEHRYVVFASYEDHVTGLM